MIGIKFIFPLIGQVDAQLNRFRLWATNVSEPTAPQQLFSYWRRGLHAPWLLQVWRKKNMLSISQNSICLPARAFKTINKIREHTMATVPLLPPSVSLSAPPLFFPSHFVLAHLPVQCRHSVVCLHLLSWGNFSTKPPHAGRQQWRTHTHTRTQK